MKKTVFIMALPCLLIFYSARSQTVKIGVNAGMSIPDLMSSGSNEISKDFKSRLAEVFGAFADFHVKKNFSLKMFINYAGQGGKRTGMQPVTGVQPGVTFYADFKNVAILNYLEVPVMAKWEWGHKWKYYADIGPYVGFLLSAKQKTSGTSPLYYDAGGTQPVTYMGQPVVQSFDANTDVKSDLHSVNFGLTGGAGIIKKICSKSELVLDVRAADGLVSIQKDTQADGKSHTGGLFVTIGYALSLKK